jgi:putative ABC transport system permease protein
MFIHYFKLALRLLIRSPFFSLVNVFGLAVGFSVFLILWQFTNSELDSDKQWKNWDRIARLGFWWEWTDDGKNWESLTHGGNSTELVARLKEAYPEIEDYTRIMYQEEFTPAYAGLNDQILITYQTPDVKRVMFREKRVACADANFFEFFSMPFIEGVRESALVKGGSVVISASIARKYFGNESALNKLVMINNTSFLVTGVFADLPNNTHHNFEIVFSNAPFLSYWLEAPTHPVCNAYIKRKVGVAWQDFENKLNTSEALQRFWGKAFEMYPNGKAKNLLQPLHEVAFSNSRTNYFFVSKSKTLLQILQLVGIVALLMAVINYINLTTSRTSKRLREIATRRVSGAAAQDFFGQFILESVLVFGVAIALALTLIQLTSGLLNHTLGLPMKWNDMRSMPGLIIIGGLAIIGSALYPVYVSRRFEPKILFSKLTPTSSRPSFVTLASFQFAIAIVLMVWGFLVYSQLNFILTKNLGFNREQILVIDAPVVRPAHYDESVDVFLDNISTDHRIQETTFCTRIMGDPLIESFHIRRPGIDIPLAILTNGGIDETFLPFFSIDLVAGRNFKPDENGNAVIISEGAVPRLGFESPEQAVGTRVEAIGNHPGQDGPTWSVVEIIGVARSYRLKPMHAGDNEHNTDDSGIALTYKSSFQSTMTAEKLALKVDVANLEAILPNVESEFSRIFPGNVFSWYVLDENINKHYSNEKVWRNRILFFTAVSIAIACLGLLAMISNKAVEKTKEIGIRKVLGASIQNITSVLLNTTYRQVLIGLLAGIPAAYYLGERYLQHFSQRVSLEWWHYAVPVLLLVAIMFSTIAFVLLKATRVNPADTLRYE